MTVSKHVLYSGRVQGVGFRYTAKHLSNGFAVAGYVRNCPDGRVELLAQGTKDQVDGFLAAIAQQLAGCIDKQEVQDQPPVDVQGFNIIR